MAIVEGDTTTILVRLFDAGDATPIDLTDADVDFRWRIGSGSITVSPMSIVNASTGRAQIQFGVGELTHGTLHGEVRITRGAEQLTSEPIRIVIKRALS